MVRFHKLALGAAFVTALSIIPSSIVGNVGTSNRSCTMAALFGFQIASSSHSPSPLPRVHNSTAFANAELTEDEKAAEADLASKAAEALIDAAEPYTPPAGSSTFAYEAEVHKMLDIVVNSLYTNKDVFLRELISNASDALDKIRFLSVTKPEMLGDTPDLEMKIEYDPDQRTLTIRDTGVGMTKEDLIANLGTVARSGTTNFVKALGEGAADVSMIGMFGVGFYSTFLVADKVTVASKNNDDDVQHIWESLNGEASFHVGPDPRGNTLGRGTEITLHLKEDADEVSQVDGLNVCVVYVTLFANITTCFIPIQYLGPRKLKEMVRHYSEFVTHPVYLREIKKIKVPVEREEEDEDEFDAEDIEGEDSKEEKAPEMEEVTTFEYEHINTDPAIWARDKEEITDEEYQEFWKVVSKGDSSGDAEEWVHFNAE